MGHSKLLLAGVSALAMVCIGLPAAAADKEIVTVVKVTGENWFTRMAEGVDKYGADTDGITARQVGPAKADAAQQTAIIQDLIAQDVDAITIVPMDPSALEGVLRRAMKRGIVITTHEADNLQNTQVDMEAFDNHEFGAHFAEQIVECMGEEGQWTSFVGSLGSLTHVQWADGGEEYAAKFPGMELVSPKNESFNDANRAYEIAKEILRTYPDIKGFQGGSAIDVIGIGRAVEEAGLEDRTCVIGLGLPKDTGPYLETGAVDSIAFWDPLDAGYVMNILTKMTVTGEEIKDGMDLGVQGYNNVKVSAGPGEGIIVRGQAWVDVDAANYKEYPF
ncbi:autoinducer 2 ABC transporter substrate-binding protein [Tropicimonas sp. TH_r6]|uniref:autoinducer 2 ABC transporter substrate-binding protein n=1 Tax=Tropicimonas sp. TH_r6 TaxID=3082085 RepID=UPI002955A07C|nr:autoinducer 2 ABC transporter substrate-binding protein [Tropicimonas sp. TH_r6]MDV7145578.1 autoinducer 2 ABC transporter substrate-binding protein [Tropicimonas sp. TH_r6]